MDEETLDLEVYESKDIDIVSGKGIEEVDIELELKETTIENLKRIQKIYLYEADLYLSLNEVLDKLLDFYLKFVPYKSHK